MDSKRLKKTNAENQNPCIWQQAGVVRHRNCKFDYHCETCRFDRALRRVARENKQMQQHGLHVDLPDMGMVESIHLCLFHWVLNDVFARIHRQGRYAEAS